MLYGMDSKNDPRELNWRPIESNDPLPSIILSSGKARSWTLVLEARGIPFRLQPAEDGWRLLVPEPDLPRARRELLLYHRENRGWPPSPPPPSPHVDNTLSTLCVLLLLATFHNLTLLEFNPFGSGPIDWSNFGNAYAGKIRNGEWWRAITALTLHADALHLLGNLTLGGIFVIRLCREVGTGFGWTLILSSGLLGNLANAALQAYHHRAVGASTAVFGAVGVLSALTLVRYRRALWRRWPLPFAAALGLLALLGAGGENTDLGAHLLGFVFGLLLGSTAGRWIGSHGRPGRRANLLLALLSAVLVLASWGAALINGGYSILGIRSF